MTCPECGTLSCYVCRKAVNGYDHFIDPNNTTSKKCVLYDTVEQRHADEVKEAAERALEKYKQEHPDVDETAIKVDLPQAAPGLPPLLPHMVNNPAFQRHHMAAHQYRLQGLQQQLQMIGHGNPQHQERLQAADIQRAQTRPPFAVPAVAAPQGIDQVRNDARAVIPQVGIGLAPLPPPRNQPLPPPVMRRLIVRNPRR